MARLRDRSLLCLQAAIVLGCADPRDVLGRGDGEGLGRQRLLAEGDFRHIGVHWILADEQQHLRLSAIEQRGVTSHLVLGSVTNREGSFCDAGEASDYSVAAVGASNLILSFRRAFHESRTNLTVVDGQCRPVAGPYPSTGRVPIMLFADSGTLRVIFPTEEGVHLVESPSGQQRLLASASTPFLEVQGRLVLGDGDEILVYDIFKDEEMFRVVHPNSTGQFLFDEHLTLLGEDEIAVFDVAEQEEVFRGGHGFTEFGLLWGSVFYFVNPEGLHLATEHGAEVEFIAAGDVCNARSHSSSLFTYRTPCSSDALTVHDVEQDLRHEFSGIGHYGGASWPDAGGPEITYLEPGESFQTLLYKRAGEAPLEVARGAWGAYDPHHLRNFGQIRANCDTDYICDAIRWTPEEGAELLYPRAAPTTLPIGDFDGSVGRLYVSEGQEPWRPYAEGVPPQTIVESSRGSLFVMEFDDRAGTLARVPASLSYSEGPLPEPTPLAEGVTPYLGLFPPPYAWLTSFHGAVYLKDFDLETETGTLVIENFDDGMAYDLGGGVSEFFEVPQAGVTYVRRGTGLWFVPFR